MLPLKKFLLFYTHNCQEKVNSKRSWKNFNWHKCPITRYYVSSWPALWLSGCCHFTVNSSRQYIATINCFLLITQPQSMLAWSLTERCVNKKLLTIFDDKILTLCQAALCFCRFLLVMLAEDKQRRVLSLHRLRRCHVIFRVPLLCGALAHNLKDP